MSDEYGFCIEESECGSKIETLTTGDGKTVFVDVKYADGMVGLGFAYGEGKGIGHFEKYTDKRTTDLNVKWQIKFSRQESIDSLIAQLLIVKNNLI